MKHVNRQKPSYIVVMGITAQFLMVPSVYADSISISGVWHDASDVGAGIDYQLDFNQAPGWYTRAKYQYFETIDFDLPVLTTAIDISLGSLGIGKQSSITDDFSWYFELGAITFIEDGPLNQDTNSLIFEAGDTTGYGAFRLSYALTSNFLLHSGLEYVMSVNDLTQRPYLFAGASLRFGSPQKTLYAFEKSSDFEPIPEDIETKETEKTTSFDLIPEEEFEPIPEKTQQDIAAVEPKINNQAPLLPVPTSNVTLEPSIPTASQNSHANLISTPQTAHNLATASVDTNNAAEPTDQLTTISTPFKQEEQRKPGRTATSSSAIDLFIQVASYANLDYLENTKKILEASGYSTRSVEITELGVSRLQVGPISQLETAKSIQNEIAQQLNVNPQIINSDGRVIQTSTSIERPSQPISNSSNSEINSRQKMRGEQSNQPITPSPSNLDSTNSASITENHLLDKTNAKDTNALAQPQQNYLGHYFIQLGIYNERVTVTQLNNQLRNQGYDTRIFQPENKKFWVLQLGPYSSYQAAYIAKGRVDRKYSKTPIVVSE